MKGVREEKRRAEERNERREGSGRDRGMDGMDRNLLHHFWEIDAP